MRAAASSIRFDVLDLVIGLPGPPGFKGSGGGALSGSELSHLRLVSLMLTVLFDATKALTWARSFCQTPKMNVDASPSETQHGPSRVLASKTTWSMPCGENSRGMLSVEMRVLCGHRVRFCVSVTSVKSTTVANI